MAAESAGPRVLAVDDLEPIRALIHRVLTSSGYRVDVVASLPQARQLNPAGYDVVLVDNSLGEDRGTDLIHELVAQDPAAAGRCLLVTGSGPCELPAGVACLGKPFGRDELICAVAGLSPAAPAGRPGSRAAPRIGPAAARRQPACPPAPTPAPAAGDARRRADGSASAAPSSGAWPLLGLVHRIRAGQQAAIADFVHDGPIQELTCAMLSLQVAGRRAQGELARELDEVQLQLGTAARAMQRLVDDDRAAVQPETDVPETIRQQCGWLPFSSVSAAVRPGPGPETSAPPQAALIADIVELALFWVADYLPAADAGVVVEPGPDTTLIELTIRPAGPNPGKTADPAGFQARLADLAQALGGTATVSPGDVSGAAQIRVLAVPRW